MGAPPSGRTPIWATPICAHPHLMGAPSRWGWPMCAPPSHFVPPPSRFVPPPSKFVLTPISKKIQFHITVDRRHAATNRSIGYKGPTRTTTHPRGFEIERLVWLWEPFENFCQMGVAHRDGGAHVRTPVVNNQWLLSTRTVNSTGKICFHQTFKEWISKWYLFFPISVIHCIF